MDVSYMTQIYIFVEEMEKKTPSHFFLSLIVPPNETLRLLFR